MTLGQKQRRFPPLLVKLFTRAYELGYEISLGEAWRPDSVAAENASSGKGIKNSLHGKRLAVDLNLFKNGVWLQRSSDHKELGEYWESLSTPELKCCWGGRFGDGNHYSIEHDGVR